MKKKKMSQKCKMEKHKARKISLATLGGKRERNERGTDKGRDSSRRRNKREDKDECATQTLKRTSETRM